MTDLLIEDTVDQEYEDALQWDEDHNAEVVHTSSDDQTQYPGATEDEKLGHGFK